MKLWIEDFKGETAAEIIPELEAREDVMDEVRGQNLRGGDFLRLLAEEIVSTAENWIETSTYWDDVR